jgi:hypothetical protein
MRKAILIGFEYKLGKRLPGITVDLYLMYKFLKGKGWRDEEILVFTDVKKDYHTKILKKSILEKNIGSDILIFIEELKERKQYAEFSTNGHYNNFSSIFPSVDNLFVYYTGHSKDRNIVLPNSAFSSFEVFANMLNKSKEAFCIMDCCSGGVILPFICHENLFRFENEIFYKNKILSIASSMHDENSITTIVGSIFTKKILSIIAEENLSIFKILDLCSSHLTRDTQTTNISSTYPDIRQIPAWFYSKNCLSITVTPYFIQIEK